ncbi:MAG: MFS transporter [Rhodospirillaceae bacterium]|jgi:MFS family permease|nr:MFS transporter [Rhodospirillaceae bacterium]MBT6136631.1 MFS transporter [Rhodospirillaceae bacterium]
MSFLLSRGSVLPVIIALATQIAVALTLASIQVAAPTIAHDIQLETRWIGPFVAGCYVAAMAVSLIAGRVVLKYDSVRASQASLVSAAIGALLFSTSWNPAMLASMVFYGAAIGLVVPASSQLIARHASSRELPLAMSLGQAGMTVGRLVAGLVVPTMAILADWSDTLIAAAVAALALAVILEGAHRPLEPASMRYHRLARRHAMAPLTLFRDYPDLRRLAFASVAFAGAQLSLVVYLVAYLHEEAGLTLTVAGFAFALAQTAGIASRFVIGALAASSGRPRMVLAGIGLAMAVSMAGASVLSPGWPTGLILLGAILLGSVAMSWNGLMFAEVIRSAGREHAAVASSAISLVTFLGLIIGPALFGGLLALGGGYGHGFLAFATLVALASVAIIGQPRLVTNSAK